MILQIIKLKSDLPEEELLKRAKERESNIKSIQLPAFSKAAP